MNFILPMATVYANSTAERKIPASQWLPAGRVLRGRATFDLRERLGDIQVGVGIEVANVPTVVTGGAVIEARESSPGMHYGSDFTDLTATTDGAQLMRFVWLVANGASSDLNLARVSGSVLVELRPA